MYTHTHKHTHNISFIIEMYQYDKSFKIQLKKKEKQSNREIDMSIYRRFNLERAGDGQIYCEILKTGCTF